MSDQVFTIEDDKRLCLWVGIKGRHWHPSGLNLPRNIIYPTVLSNPTPDTEKLVADALVEMGFSPAVYYHADNKNLGRIWYDEFEKWVDGDGEYPIARAAHALMLSQEPKRTE